MTTLEAGFPQRATRPAATLAGLLPVFAGTLFLSAFLLFAVEPMFAKMVLPVLGGSPSVWSVAMVFFQGLLLAGYVYAHVLTRLVSQRVAALVHLGLNVIAAAMLPIGLHGDWGAPPEQGQAIWLLGLFGACVGVPFFAVSANGPLLQTWFARSGHRHAADPYFLYGASNIGSFAALVAYPFLFEPLSGLSMQSRMWSVGFAVLAVGLAVCALMARPTASPAQAVPVANTTAQPRRRLGWIALAFVPSGLLVSVTAHISTDIAAAPLIWVVPLALFLLTFVLTFRRTMPLSERALGCAQIWAAAFGLMNLGMGNTAPAIGIVAHLALFFLTALVCHRALYQRRPDSQHLTEFYLYLSLGGVLGGLFAGLVATNIFSTVLEYPILIVAGLFCQQGFIDGLRRATRRTVIITTAACALVLFVGWMAAGRLVAPDQVRLGLSVLFGIALLLVWRQPPRVAILAVGAAFVATLYQGLIIPRETYRSFFGVEKVMETSEGHFRILMHGTTMHGAMRIRDDAGNPVEGPVRSTTYYTQDGPMGEALRSLRALRGPLDVSVIGLGVGALSCQMQPGEHLTYYEIDPIVVRLARDPAHFRFLQQCTPDAPIIVGDARTTIAAQEKPSDMIVVDAFSSDAIPVHLLTREAIALYMSKLAPHGLLVLHISNNVMDLGNVVAAVAAENGLVAYERRDLRVAPDDPDFRTASIVAVLARDPADLGSLARAGSAWRPLTARPGTWSWTDDYSTILTALRDKFAPAPKSDLPALRGSL